MTTLFQEARYGLRLLLKSPGLTHNDARVTETLVCRTNSTKNEDK
jgi:hypothetical protein